MTKKFSSCMLATKFRRCNILHGAPRRKRTRHLQTRIRSVMVCLIQSSSPLVYGSLNETTPRNYHRFSTGCRRGTSPRPRRSSIRSKPTRRQASGTLCVANKTTLQHLFSPTPVRHHRTPAHRRPPCPSLRHAHGTIHGRNLRRPAPRAIRTQHCQWKLARHVRQNDTC